MRPDFTAAARHCEAAWPREGVCAYLARTDGWDFVALPNVADELHQRSPRDFPQSAATAFVIEPRAWMALERRVLAMGAPGDEPHVWLAHSHVDVAAVLSASDQQAFTVDGASLLPGLGLAVFEVRAGRAGPPSLWRFTATGWTPACSTV
ncbi:MAG: Mov34/MPN/PAD-1 family protein [Myxococcaceae bacterium]|nr:Mov34/MPN/PAD-1 family protein [Myxococcaceae bacterium]